MSRSGFAVPRIRLLLGSLGAVLLMGIFTPARADTNPPGPGSLAQAQQQLAQAQQQAAGADTALASALSTLGAAQAHLGALNAQVAGLDAQIAAQNAAITRLQAQEQADRDLLRNYMLQSYSRGQTGTLDFLLSGSSFTDMLNRQADISAFASAGGQLVNRVNAEQQQAQQGLAQLKTQRAQLAVVQAQAAASEEVVAAQEAQVAAADSAAHAGVRASKNTVEGILTAQQIAAQPPAPKGGGTVFPPVSSSAFTIDTDLTVPSGLTAGQIDQFLSGTAMAGLGSAFISAEQQYHVSARYFVAHAILESAWGSSQLAQGKHNLFGYGADDANPYGDAVTFSSFADCINFVAHQVSVYYLTPGGAFYHGPTLRGMNVDYASDPNWAVKIASIANDIP
jgi:peptidoglycan hydrolase CwlO-like protein